MSLISRAKPFHSIAVRQKVPVLNGDYKQDNSVPYFEIGKDYKTWRFEVIKSKPGKPSTGPVFQAGDIVRVYLNTKMQTHTASAQLHVNPKIPAIYSEYLNAVIPSPTSYDLAPVLHFYEECDLSEVDYIFRLFFEDQFAVNTPMTYSVGGR